MRNNVLELIEKNIGVELNEKAISRFETYTEMLIDWNKKINLTAIVNPNEIEIKHFYDSLLAYTCLNPQKPLNLIDIGTGAGFPGIPMKIVNPHLKLTLLDSLNKRLLFLKELLQKLELDAEILHLRAEEGARQKNLRENFDIAISRAVAPLNVLSEYCLGYVKENGFFIAMKGPSAFEEIENANKAIELMGGKIEEVKELNLPNDSKRIIIKIKKIKRTPEGYPRHGSKITKKTL